MTCDAMHGSGGDRSENTEFTPTIQGFDFLNDEAIAGGGVDTDLFQLATPFDRRKLDLLLPPCISSSISISAANWQRHSTSSVSPPIVPMSSSSASSSSSHEGGGGGRGGDPDVRLVPVFSRADGMYDDRNDMRVMETLEYMDMVDDVDIWDASLLFGAPDADPKPQSHQEQSLLQQQHQQQEDVDMAIVFFEWLKTNKESISAEDLRKIKLKRSTIDSAARRLGGGKNGMKQLLMLILEWVKQHRLQKKNSDFESCDIWQTPWLESQFGNLAEATGTVTSLDSTIGGILPPSYHYFPETSPPCSSSQYSGGCVVPENCMYPIQYQRTCDFRQSGNGRKFTGLGASATKEARRKRMARQRRGFPHVRKHNRSLQPNLVTEKEDDAQIGDGNCSDVLIRGRNWMYCSKPAPATAITERKVVNHASVDLEYCQQLLASEERTMGGKPENNMRFLLQKVLKQSDVGGLGRIVLPKKDAEANLPELEARDGISMAIEDIGTKRVWNMRYRFWPNNKSRMYLLENTGDFVRCNGLEEGDFIVIYSDDRNEKYMIRGVKVCRPNQK